MTRSSLLPSVCEQLPGSDQDPFLLLTGWWIPRGSSPWPLCYFSPWLLGQAMEQVSVHLPDGLSPTLAAWNSISSWMERRCRAGDCVWSLFLRDWLSVSTASFKEEGSLWVPGPLGFQDSTPPTPFPRKFPRSSKPKAPVTSLTSLRVTGSGRSPGWVVGFTWAFFW